MTGARFFKSAFLFPLSAALFASPFQLAAVEAQPVKGAETVLAGSPDPASPVLGSAPAPGARGLKNSLPAEGAPVAAPDRKTSTQGSPTYYVQGQAVSANKYQAAVLASEGLALMRSNQNEQAADKLKQAVALAPDLPEAHHNLGLVLAKLGDVSGAIAEIDQAIALKSDLDSSWLTLGGLHQSAGHIQEAIDTYRKFLDKFPNHPMHKKIVDLVAGLTNENKSMVAAQRAAEVLQPPSGTAEGVLQVPGQAAGAESDYVAEVTRSGVFRWPSSRMPLKVYVHPGVRIDPSNGKPSGFRDEFRDVLLRSFEDWSKAAGGLVRFVFVDNPHDATLECFWVSRPVDLKNPAEAGEANVYTNQDGIASGKIKLLTQSMSPVLPLTVNRMRVICLHEIGHALGLAGHTANPDDIMFYSVSFKDQWRELSGRDCRTIKRLYSSN